ncbi:MAG: cytochrome D1 [Bdellovibrio bacteriovorus]
MHPVLFHRRGLLRLAAAFALGALIGGAQAAPEPAADSGDAAPENRVVREGVAVEFSVRPAHEGSDTVVAADWADVSFRITDAGTGEPVKGRYPAAWMDLAKAWQARGESPMTCRDRVSTFLKGIVGVRPMIDLNSHYLLVMNRDASISVIDPAVGITGITNLFAQVVLERPAADWAKTRDQQRLFVTMPLAGKVAVVDLELFKVSAAVDAGEKPTRAALQNDERYLWVGNNASRAEDSGVSVIDTASLERVAFIPTGAGHHEIALSDDDAHAFVTNRDSGTVSVIDVRTLAKVKDLETGPVPIALALSPLSKALYVADGKAGTISIIDPAGLEIRGRIEAQPGLGPLRFSPDGRWGVVVNPVQNAVHVIDASTDRLVHTVPVGSQPYQVSFTRQYAYIRSLGSEQVGLIALGGLDDAGVPPVTYFPAGQGAPGRARDVSIADSIIPSAKEAAAYVVNQAEGTVYYYMEGMNAPMGSFRNYGHEARAIEIADRSLREREPGVYTGRVKIPVEGTYDVAFVMDTPRFVHCFSAPVAPNPQVRQAAGPMGVEFQIAQRMVPVGGSVPVRFRLTDPVMGQPLTDLSDVTLLYYASDGRDRTVVPATAVGPGEYEATVTVRASATYYLFVGAASQGANYTDLPYATLLGVAPAAPAPPVGAAQGEKQP